MPKNLLVADDSITIRKVIGMLFATEDFQVHAVDNGLDAIARTRELRPDIVLADVVMPGKSGYEVCEALKNDPSTQNIPVLLLAGTFEQFDAERARAARADDHVTKPFESQVLIDKVKALAGVSASAPASQPTAPSPAAAMPTPSGPATVRPPLGIPGGPAPMARPGMAPPGAQPGMARPPMGGPGMPPPGMARPPMGGPGMPPPGMARPPMGGPGMPPPGGFQPRGPGMPPPGMAPQQQVRGRDPFGLGGGQPAPAQMPPQGRPPAAAPGVRGPAADGGEAMLRDALSRASREVIEKIAWEVVPQLAETIIREELERLIKERGTQH